MRSVLTSQSAMSDYLVSVYPTIGERNSLSWYIQATIGMSGCWLILFWIVLYSFARNVKPSKKEAILDTKTRIISIVHGVLVLALSFTDLIRYRTIVNEKNSFFQEFTMLFSMSYFLYDLLCCLYYNLYDLDLIFHHTLVFLGLVHTIMLGYGGSTFLFGFIVAEISNAPMHLRKILANHGLRHTKLYELMESAYFKLYMFARGGLGPLMTVKCVTSPKVPTFLSVVTLGLVIQSFMFFRTMRKIIKKTNSNKEERREKGIELSWFSVHPKVFSLSYTKGIGKEEKVF